MDLQKSPEPKYTMKQLLWLKEYVVSGNATQAALKVYNCTEGSARVIGSENIAKLNISDLMEEMAMSDKNLVALLRKNIADASRKVLKKTRSYGQIRQSDKEAYYFSKKGKLMATNVEEITEFEYEDAPDYQAKNKAIEIALKLKKKLGPDTAVQNNSINLQGATVKIINYADLGGGDNNERTSEQEIQPGDTEIIESSEQAGTNNEELSRQDISNGTKGDSESSPDNDGAFQNPDQTKINGSGEHGSVVGTIAPEVS